MERETLHCEARCARFSLGLGLSAGGLDHGRRVAGGRRGGRCVRSAGDLERVGDEGALLVAEVLFDAVQLFDDRGTGELAVLRLVVVAELEVATGEDGDAHPGEGARDHGGQFGVAERTYVLPEVSGIHPEHPGEHPRRRSVLGRLLACRHLLVAHVTLLFNQTLCEPVAGG